jgi:hypothetical protein
MMSATIAMIATELAEQIVLVEKWLGSAPEDTVIRFGEYSPNGSPHTWQEYVLPEQSGTDLTVDTENGAEQIWDTIELSEDGLTLNLRRLPSNWKHVYHSYTRAPAADVSQEILTAFQGADDSCDWDDLKGLASFLNSNMNLETDSDGFKAVMKLALQEAIDNLD